MFFRCTASQLRGAAAIPGSKSHTIRAVVIAALADGESVIEAPLLSADAQSAAACAAQLGAEVDMSDGGVWRVRGFGSVPRPKSDVLDTGNSGTTMNILLGISALLPAGREITLTGDHQVQRRPNGPLAAALNNLGASVVSERGDGCPPFRIRGTLKGGFTTLDAPTSQYLTILLLACPLAEGDTEIELTRLNEASYAQMTLDWLAFQGIRTERDGWKRVRIPGRQHYRPFTRRIPADFSSASFFLCAGAIPGNEVLCRGLDMDDCQGDKAVVGYLRQMGAEITLGPDGVRVRGGRLRGIEIDMDETPDALPVMAVLGCFAEGTTVLHNVAHARIKETDRIAVMAAELRKMGARIEERPDGLVIHRSALHGAAVEGHGDHRVVMSLALAGMSCPGETTVTTAEAAGVTFPNYAELMRNLGGKLAAE